MEELILTHGGLDKDGITEPRSTPGTPGTPGTRRSSSSSS
eukprot:CAMPEP_0119509106 /NCGR_PEP_ID=MMETSP1344-20130328/28514_1 /TAXON_ID=236787 /ORGANISM="Florenciella parvula, Strain CCMP2471" /LENGTH=39 /DNA_ID= /DNA_START= /DNA_END= /DNA_ORIENTATION=